MKRKLMLAGQAAFVLVWTAALAAADDLPVKESPAIAGQESKFIRVSRDDERRPVAMETAVVRYSSAERPGCKVDLVGAVHVGDKAYYDELNKLFDSYEVVLYELVAPEGTKIPKEGRKSSGHPIGFLQEGMSTLLELRHQLACVDYSKKNFVHADMSPDEFSRTMAERGESFFQMFLQLMGQGMAQSASGEGPNDAAILMALFSKDRATKLKVAIAQQFENLEGQLAVLDGPSGSTILTERNRKCFEVLDKQLKEGKKSIAIFYGAAHLPDMERRLLADYGLKRDSEKWLAAWRLQTAK
jgi:hypothetical protein